MTDLREEQAATGIDAAKRTKLTRTILVLTALGCLGCPSDEAEPAADGGPVATCAMECDDGRFCNGVETCRDGRCVTGPEPCPSSMFCDEDGRVCLSDCGVASDADGDGFDAIACGGTDCDDTDPEVNPGQTEVCDGEGVDEDCDPSTIGDRDADGDGFVDLRCCNGATCGLDCDDGQRGVNPDVPEVCDGFDNDCDGAIDETGEPLTWFPDADGDNFGDAAATPIVTCANPPEGWVANGRDCDDTRAEVNPGNPEVPGNGRDDNCNGRTDEGATILREAGLSVLGGTARRGSMRLSEGRIETFSRVCAGDRCLTGGVLP